MANPIRGEVEIRAGATMCRLKVTWDALANVQDDFNGVPIDDVPKILQAALTTGSVRAVPKIAYRLAQAGGYADSYAAFAALEWDDPLALPADIMRAFTTCGFWKTADSPVADEGAPSARPRPATSGKRS